MFLILRRQQSTKQRYDSTRYFLLFPDTLSILSLLTVSRNSEVQGTGVKSELDADDISRIAVCSCRNTAAYSKNKARRQSNIEKDYLLNDYKPGIPKIRAASLNL